MCMLERITLIYIHEPAYAVRVHVIFCLGKFGDGTVTIQSISPGSIDPGQLPADFYKALYDPG